jgi:hypothetical protein
MSMYAGMTVNERLHVSGKLNEYDKAVASKNAGKVKHILKELEVDDGSIKAILEDLGLATGEKS